MSNRNNPEWSFTVMIAVIAMSVAAALIALGLNERYVKVEEIKAKHEQWKIEHATKSSNSTSRPASGVMVWNSEVEDR